jgi:hypothetical protein
MDKGMHAISSVLMTMSRAFRKASRRASLTHDHRILYAYHADDLLVRALAIGGSVAGTIEVAQKSDGRSNPGGNGKA